MNNTLFKLVDFLAWILIVCGAVGGVLIALFLGGSDYMGGFGYTIGYGFDWERLMMFISNHSMRALLSAVVGFFVGLSSTAFFAGFWVLISNINKNIDIMMRLNHEQMKVQRLMCETILSAVNKSLSDKHSDSHLATNLSAVRENS